MTRGEFVCFENRRIGKRKYMKVKTRVVVGVLLGVIGIVVATYFYTQLRAQDVLFNLDSIPIDGRSYVSYEIIVNLDGKFAPKVTGGVGSVGSSVDFYIVNYTSWNSWSMNPDLRSAFSMVHLNASAISSQLSSEDQFSFIPAASAGYSAVFVNDEYPSANNASVHATITLQYISLNSLYGLLAGLVMLCIGLVILAITALIRSNQSSHRHRQHIDFTPLSFAFFVPHHSNLCGIRDLFRIKEMQV